MPRNGYIVAASLTPSPEKDEVLDWSFVSKERLPTHLGSSLECQQLQLDELEFGPARFCSPARALRNDE